MTKRSHDRDLEFLLLDEYLEEAEKWGYVFLTDKDADMASSDWRVTRSLRPAALFIISYHIISYQ
jgi:hypothetical protein